MMHNHPFFRNHVPSTNRGGEGRYTREAPIRQRQTSNESQKPSPNIISIPVHFVESDNTKSSSAIRIENTRSISAVRIQKVFRGFLVRKNVKKIFTIKRQVDGIENRISQTVDLIRRDAKERLKVNEMLMALLFKLDSVRGIDSGVRDCRKAVIKKAIMLQEKLDAIANGDDNEQKTLISSEEQLEDTTADDDDTKEAMEMDTTVEQESEINDHVCEFNELNSQEELVEEKSEITPESAEIAAEEEETVCGGGGLESENKDGSIEEEEEGYLLVKKEGDNEDDDAMEEVEQCDLKVEEKVEKSDEKKELLEKMVERNEILIGLVADLCEKNKMQTQMISSLTKRVDNLEKAFKCERSKCKKSRK